MGTAPRPDGAGGPTAAAGEPGIVEGPAHDRADQEQHRRNRQAEDPGADRIVDDAGTSVPHMTHYGLGRISTRTRSFHDDPHRRADVARRLLDLVIPGDHASRRRVPRSEPFPDR